MSKPNRYVLFYGNDYYPSGGWEDYQGSYTSESEALDAANKLTDVYRWWHVVDLEDGRIIHEG